MIIVFGNFYRLFFLSLFLCFLSVTKLKGQEKGAQVQQDSLILNEGYGYLISAEKDTLFGMLNNRFSDAYCRIRYVDTISGKHHVYHPHEVIKFQMGNRTYISADSKFLELVFKSRQMNLYRVMESRLNQLAAIGPGIAIAHGVAVAAATGIVTSVGMGLVETDFYFFKKGVSKRITMVSTKKQLIEYVIFDNPAFIKEIENLKWKELKKGNTIIDLFRKYYQDDESEQE